MRKQAAKRRGAEERSLGPSLAHSREAHFACPNRRGCLQASHLSSHADCCQIMHVYVLKRNRTKQQNKVLLSNLFQIIKVKKVKMS